MTAWKRAALPLVGMMLGLSTCFWSCWEQFGYPTFTLSDDPLTWVYIAGLAMLTGCGAPAGHRANPPSSAPTYEPIRVAGASLVAV